ncbi:hypothetical protein BH20ACT23_BH20ACT23_29050 [soil metagenome]
MARTNLHQLASRLLAGLAEASNNGATSDRLDDRALNRFEGKLRDVAAEAGLNSVRTAEAVKLLEELGRIEVVQRGRRGRDTVITIFSTEPVKLEDAEASLPSRQSKRVTFTYDEIGRAMVDRLLELSRDDGLRTAQVEAFDAEGRGLRDRIAQLEREVDSANAREEDLRIRLRAAEESLKRSEENLRRAVGGGAVTTQPGEVVSDDDSKAVLEILRSRAQTK